VANLPIRHTHLSPRLGPQTSETELDLGSALTLQNQTGETVLELVWWGERDGLSVTTFAAQEQEQEASESPAVLWPVLKGMTVLLLVIVPALLVLLAFVYALVFAARLAWG
jgi:hypothetical protein